ncbi:MAG: hypothetical protein IH889_04705 [Planctomycetes bacterium]|nr:hypothetical protein [Planctomycetota bacterium]
MASEAKRGLIRMAANYTRVFSVVFLGLLVVPMLLKGTGSDGWALIALLGSTIGLASMAQEVVRSSLIRELGAAYHRGRADEFRSTYNAAVAISAAIALLLAGVFAALWFVVPLLQIPDHLIPAARWLVVARGAETFAVLLLAAPFNMYLVTERMVAFNAWLIVNRLCYVIAASLIIIQGIGDPGPAVTLYAFVSAGLVIASQLLAVAVMIWIDRRLIPAPAAITRDALKSVLQVGGWNAAATTATATHVRLGPVIMNLAFSMMSLPSGLFGNLILGLAIRLTVTVRQITMGMTGGLDAVSARLSTTQSAGAVRTLMHHSTRLHGLATFPAAIGVLVLAEPVLRLWVGNRLEDPQNTLPLAITLIQVMTLGMVARAISDGWIHILYGAGHVRRYAPLILLGGIINPLLAVLLLGILPTSMRYTAVAWAYSAVLIIIHAGLLPLVGAKALQISYGQFFRPLVRPLAVALACTPILLLSKGQPDEWSFVHLVVVVGTYSVAYAAGCIMFVMDRGERVRFTKAALRRLPRRISPGWTDRRRNL